MTTSLEPLRYEVRRLLADVDERIRDAEHARSEGPGEAKVRAAGRLTLLLRHRGELRARLRELETCGGSTGEAVLQWLKEEGMVLHQRFEAWVAGA